jgi:hypothetical protein
MINIEMTQQSPAIKPGTTTVERRGAPNDVPQGWRRKQA